MMKRLLLMKKTMLEYAELYFSKGFSLIPVKLKQKRPAIRWKKYQLRKPTHDELKKWFGHKRGYGIGIVTGNISGTCILDFDSLEAYHEAKRKGLPETPTVKTSKGRHLYLKYPDGISNLQNRVDISGFDIRGDGGYVVAPPSVHPSGFRYEWVEGKSLNDLPLAELPEWLTRELRTPVHSSRHNNKQSQKLVQKIPFDELLQGVNEGARNHSMTRIAGWLISQGFSYEHCLRFMLKINQKNRPPLPPREVRTVLNSIMRKEHHRTESLVQQKLKELQSVWKMQKNF